MCKTGLNGCNFALKRLYESLNGAYLPVHCWRFLQWHGGSLCHHASCLQLTQKRKGAKGKEAREKTSGPHASVWGLALAQTQQAADRDLWGWASTQRMTREIQTFLRYVSSFACHSIPAPQIPLVFFSRCECSVFGREMDPYWIMREELCCVEKPLSNPLWSGNEGNG